MKKTPERRNKKHRPSTTTLSGIKTTWGRALMIDYSFMSADPYKNPVKFKYNRKIRDVIICSEKENKVLQKHEFSKICAEIMFKCEAENNNRNKKESRFDINVIVMAVLSSKVSAYPVKNPDGQAYHTSIASVINISTLSIREIDFLKIAFAGFVDYEIGTISAEILYSEKDPNEEIVKNYVNASPVIMINHITDIVKSQGSSAELSDEVKREVAEYSASLNIDKGVISCQDVIDNKKIGDNGSKVSMAASKLLGDNVYAVVMIGLFCFLLNRLSYHTGIDFGVRGFFSTAAILLGIYMLRKRFFGKKSSGGMGGDSSTTQENASDIKKPL